jgi:hypothetical protein
MSAQFKAAYDSAVRTELKATEEFPFPRNLDA